MSGSSSSDLGGVTNHSHSCALCSSRVHIPTGIKPPPYTLPEYRFEILRCASCGLMSTQPQLTPTELKSVYDLIDYYSLSEATDQSAASGSERLRWSVRSRVTRYYYARDRKGAGLLTRLIAMAAHRRFGWAPSNLQGSHLLDVGCGDGAFLLDARDAGWTVQGLEFSETAGANAARLGLNVTIGRLEDRPFEPESFDVVRLWSVLEHLSDPCGAMREVARILRPGGWAIVQTPNARSPAARLIGDGWIGWQIPVHLNHFTPATLERTIRTTRLLPVEVHHASIGTLTCGLHPNLRSARYLIVLVDYLLDLLKLGDCVVVFARKPA